MKKIYCDFCGNEIKPNLGWKLTLLANGSGYTSEKDMCDECLRMSETVSVRKVEVLDGK